MTPIKRSCLDRTIAAVSEALATDGFGGVSPPVNLGKAHRLTWRRPRGWKTDCVTLDYGLHWPRDGVRAQVHVEFAGAPGGSIEIGTNVGYILGGRTRTTRIPFCCRGVVQDSSVASLLISSRR